MAVTLDRTDAQLCDRITRQLEWTRDVDAHDIGVRAIVNDIAVKTGAVEDAELERSANWKRIVVSAERGRVRLSGEVFSLLEKEQAERAAWANPGVVAVDNQLDVTSRRWW